MSRIIMNDLTFSYKEYYQPIFSNVNISFDTDWKLGLIGRNGKGKTTLLRLLHKELEPDRGTIVREAATELFPYSVRTEYINSLDVLKENIGFLKSMEDRMEEILKLQEQKDIPERSEKSTAVLNSHNNAAQNSENSKATENAETTAEKVKAEEALLEEYQRILLKYMELDGYLMESRIKKELGLMQLPERLLSQDYELLSGGEKTKLQIIALFLRKDAFILLDEPTNHLDIEGKRILADYLRNKKGFLVVSHDRKFLDEVVDHILSINKSNIAIEKGNYTSWRTNKEMTEEYELRTKEKLEREIEVLEKVSVRTRNWAAIAETEKNPFPTNNRGNSSRSAKFMRQAKAAEQNIRDNLNEKKNLLKNYELTPELMLRQQEVRASCLVSAYDLSFGYTDSLLLDRISFCINKGDRIWIRGCNGAGKSTLLKIIGKRISCARIQHAENLVIETAFQEPLWTEGYIQDLITDPEVRSIFLDICHRLDMKYDVLKRPIETFSSGEQKKIDMARALASPNQLLLLDEPLNFMDISFREQLEKAILAYTPTIVFVEHDERFGNNVSTGIINLS